MTKIGSLPAALATCLLSATGVMAEVGNAEEGKTVFMNRCSECHDVETGKTKIGPTLVGLWGRKSGTVAGFAYSEAMIAAGVTWDETTLSAYLLNPKKFIPRNKMSFNGLKRPGELEDLIEFFRAAGE